MTLSRSALLDGRRHGFTTRLGGVSSGRYATLNLGARWGDEAAAVDENRRRVAAEGGFDLARLATARQVHGATVALADGRSAEELAAVDADALVATEPGRAVAVYTADCAPLLLADDAGRVAAVHAGWRGAVLGVAEAAVEALVALGSRRDRLRAAVGPSIGPCCFEVGEEVAARFDPRDVVRRPGAPRPHVDLRRALRRRLEGAGLAAARIDDAAPCTHCDATRYFSFRRDGAGIGQMLSFIVAG